MDPPVHTVVSQGCVRRWRIYTLSWDTEVIGRGIDRTQLEDLAAEQLEPGQHLEFDYSAPVSPSAVHHWRRTSALVHQLAAANATLPATELLPDELSHLLAGAALLCFPNPIHNTAQPAHAAGPVSLRRAVEYIEDNADQPIQITDIAGAARVSSRALNETFRRHLGTSPTGYLRRTRLDRAHQDLQTAHPGDGRTVTSIANRWGFHSLPRFGVTYRQTYGRPPSQTLRHDG